MASPALDNAVCLRLSHYTKCHSELGKTTFLSTLQQESPMTHYHFSLHQNFEDPLPFSELWRLYGRHVTHLTVDVPLPNFTSEDLQKFIIHLDFVHHYLYAVEHLTLCPSRYWVTAAFSSFEPEVQKCISSLVVDPRLKAVYIYGFYEVNLYKGYTRSIGLHVSEFQN